MRKLTSLAVAAAAAALLWTAPASSASLDAKQKEEIEQLVRDYLLKNPEILREMSENLQAKEQAAADQARNAALAQSAEPLFKNAGDPVVGNPKGDVTVIEFMDYNCGWCKKGLAEIATLVENDKNVRVIFKEFPIFGAGSEFAARAAIASSKQGKYWELHQALFKHDGPVTEEVTRQIASELGLDMARLEADMKGESVNNTLAVTQALANTLQLTGTPAFIVDDKVFPGYIPQEELLKAIAQVRSAGCKFC
ncbi:MAG: DsbA family protein [Rhizobiales bacterium]|nr:DsbA family protein [Hyphomicrobiales bacterium]